MDILRELMNFDSFWTLWFWLAHVIAWSMASHFTMGVPYDVVIEANREEGEDGPYAQAAEAMLQAQMFRFARLGERYGVGLTGAVAFLLTVLATLGILADLEFARALATIVGPLTFIYVLTILAAISWRRKGLSGAALRAVLKRQRIINQLVGLMGVLLAVIGSMYEALRNIESFLQL